MRRKKPPLTERLPGELKTARLTLRRPQAIDAEAIYRYAGDVGVTRFLAWPTHTGIADTEAFLQRVEEGWRQGGYPVWLIEDESGVVGSIGAQLSKANAGIGYVLARERWGKGYATEALRRIIDLLFSQVPIEAIWAVCVTENPASRRVLEKCGFQYVRTQPHSFNCPNLGGEAKDVWLFCRDRNSGMGLSH